MRPAFDIIVLGDYFYDLIYTGLPRFPELGRELHSRDVTTTGGAMYITAVSLHRLGAKVGWPAYFGNDYYSESVYHFMQAEGLDMSLAKHVDHPYRRVTTALPLEGERAFVTFTDPEEDDLYAHWRQALEQSDFKHLHIGGLDAFDQCRPMIQYARERGATVSIDAQDGPFLSNPHFCQEKLALVDIFLPNAREACAITEQSTVQAALDDLARLVPLVVIKDGPRGAWLAHRGEIIHVPALEVGPVVDTTGAGDCFNAGFLYGLICERAPLETCLRYANICGGMSVTGVGGATHAPTRAQLDEWMAKLAVV